MPVHSGQPAHSLPAPTRLAARGTWATAVQRPAGGAWRSRLLLLLMVSALHAGLLLWLAQRSPPPAQQPPPMPDTVSVQLLAPTPAAALSPMPPAVTPPSKRQGVSKQAAVNAPSAPKQPTARQVAPPARLAANPTQERASTASAPAEAAQPLTLPLAQARGQNNPRPSYPEMSRRLGEEGQVQLAVLILADGTVAEVTVQRSSGYPRLDSAAVSAVRQWHYQPARRGNTAIDYRYRQPVTFSLND